MTEELGNIKSSEKLKDYVKEIEKKYTMEVFDKLFNDSGKMKESFEKANLVKEVWIEKMKVDPRNELSSWSQVAENLFQGFLHRSFLEWSPAAFPVGSEIQFETSDAILHIDIKTHREGDSDLDRTQDVRPEQISGSGDYKGCLPSILPKTEMFVEDAKGRLGDVPPKLPPYYDFGDGKIKICITLFVICVYELNAELKERTMTRIQVFCAPNGMLRFIEDYRDSFQAGKDGRSSHRYRINLVNLSKHEDWRWKEIGFGPNGSAIIRR